MSDNDDGVDRRLSRRSLLLGAFILPLVVLEPEPASAQLGLIGAMLGGFRFRHRRYRGYHHYRVRRHFARHRGRVRVASRHRHSGGGGGGGGGGSPEGGGQFSKGGL
jgi:hypothetical protein